jgi:hypothetical protein
MKKALIALFALAACSQQTPSEAPATHSDHAGMTMNESAAPVEGASAQIGQLSISQAWAAATPGGVTVGAGYLMISNAGAADDRLISASSPRAAKVEVHEMSMDGAMITMRKLDSLAIPAGGAATLAPGGTHLMFLDIKTPFAAGETVPVTLNFEHAGAVTLELPVRQR